MDHTPESAQPLWSAEKYQDQPRFWQEAIKRLTKGYSFGLGMRVLTNVVDCKVFGSEGEYGWAGNGNSYFWIDPQEDLIGIILAQYYPLNHYPAARQFKVLMYQALCD